MTDLPHPPRAFDRFVSRFPKAGEAWTLLQQAAQEAGPLDPKATRLAKLAIAIGALREGAVSSAVRKAIAVGLTQNEMEQLVALAAPTIGMPASVAAHGWILETIEKSREPKS